MNLSRLMIRIIAATVALAVLAFATIVIVVGTEPGSRWALAMASRYVPGSLELSEASGSFIRGLEIDSLVWQTDSLRIDADEAAINIDLPALLAWRIDIRQLAAERLRIQMSAMEPPADPGAPRDFSLPITLIIDQASVAELLLLRGENEYRFESLGISGQLSGSNFELNRAGLGGFGIAFEASGSGQLAGTLPIVLHARWEQIGSDDLKLAGVLDITGDSNRYALEHKLIAPFAVTTTGEAQLAAGGFEVDLISAWPSIVATATGHDIQVTAGSLRLHGTAETMEIELDTGAILDSYPQVQVDVRASTDYETLYIKKLLLANDIGNLEATGRLEAQPLPVADIAFNAFIDPSALIIGTSGNVDMSGSVRALLPAAGPEGSLHIDRVTGQFNELPLEATAHFDYTPAELAIREISLDLGKSQARASGYLGEAVELSAELDIAAIEDFLPEASGNFLAAISITGPRSRPKAMFELQGAGISYGQFRARTLVLEARGSSLAHVLSAELQADELRLELGGSGSFDGAAWDVTIPSLGMSGARLGQWQNEASARMTVRRDGATLHKLCLSEATTSASACSSFELRTDGVSNFDLSVVDLPASALPIPWPAGVAVNGRLGAQARGTVRDHKLSAQASIAALDAAFAAEFEGERVGLTLTEAAGTLSILDNRTTSSWDLRLDDDLGEAHASLNFDDIRDSTAAIHGSVAVALRDASALGVFFPDLAEPQARIEGTLEISGSLANPRFAGEIELSHGRFGIRPAGIEISDLTVRAKQLESGDFELSGSARSGEGIVSIDGRTRVDTGTGLRSEIAISGNDFELLRLPDMQLTASPDVNVVLDERMARVTGRLGIPSANIIVKTLPRTAVKPSHDAIVHTSGSTRQPSGILIDVDVDTVLGEAVRLEGFGLRTQLAGAVRLQGGSVQPYVGFGQLDLIGGRYEAYGQDLTIERGQLTFDGPLADPELDIRATRRAGDVTAGILLTGRPSRLQSSVFSDPQLSDAETLSYLLTGKPLTGATTPAEGDLLNQAAFSLGMSRAGAIAAQLGTALGLESLSLEGGAESGRIVAGKRIGGKLLVEYGYGLIDKLGTLLLRYQINDRLLLESRSGTVSNLDIVYSVKKP